MQAAIRMYFSVAAASNGNQPAPAPRPAPRRPAPTPTFLQALLRALSAWAT